MNPKLINYLVKIQIVLIIVVLKWSTADRCNVVCFFNEKAFRRDEQIRFTIDDLKNAVHMCTHLVYGYIGFEDENGKLGVKNGFESESDQFQSIMKLKEENSRLRIFLSMGGFADEEDLMKYLNLLENESEMDSLVQQLSKIVEDNKLDGIDLAWRFPNIDLKMDKSILGVPWNIKAKEYIFQKDVKTEEHKNQFTKLCEKLSASLKKLGEDKMLTMTVMPRINETAYFDPEKLNSVIGQIHMMSFDYKTPYIEPDIARWSSPIQYPRNVGPRYYSAVMSLEWWTKNGMDNRKLFLGISTFGRSWKLNSNHWLPPASADGPGESGLHFNVKGSMAYLEFCKYVVLNYGEINNQTYLRIFNSHKSVGPYAFRIPKSGRTGMFISFEDAQFSAMKARYARLNELGGVAVFDITLDDFKGVCGEPFPILTAAKLHI